MNSNIFISVFLSVLGGLMIILGIVHLKNDERGSIRLDPPSPKPEWYAVIVSPGFVYLAFLCGVLMLFILALLFLTDPVLLSVQGGGI